MGLSGRVDKHLGLVGRTACRDPLSPFGKVGGLRGTVCVEAVLLRAVAHRLPGTRRVSAYRTPWSLYAESLADVRQPLDSPPSDPIVGRESRHPTCEHR